MRSLIGFEEPITFFTMRCLRTLSFTLTLAAVCTWAQSESFGTIQIRVLDAETKRPLSAANVWVGGTLIGTATDAQGLGFIRNLPSGTYTIEVSFIGYETKVLRGIVVRAGLNDELEIRLQPRPVSLSEVTVSPSLFSFSSLSKPNYQFRREELKVLPTIINDPIRALQAFPGTSSDYMNAKVGIRGSRPEDMLYVIDDMEIWGNIFHFERAQGSGAGEINGGISIINNNILETFNLSLGGFPANFGNKAGGVLSMTTISPEIDGIEANIGLNFINAYTALKAKSGDHRFVLSAQGGYIDLLMMLFGDSNMRFRYYDLFAKYEYAREAYQFSVTYLHAGDDIAFTDYPGTRVIHRSNYYLNHLWGRFKTVFGSSLFSNTMLYTSILPEKTFYDLSTKYTRNLAEYRKDVLLYGLKQTFLYELSQQHLIEVGVNVKRTESLYEFREEAEELYTDSTTYRNLNVDPQGYDAGSYISYKIRPFGPEVVFDLGVRHDHQSYIRSNNQQLSPRFTVAVELPYQTVARAAYGQYYQPTDLANLQSYDLQWLQTTKANHVVLGLENSLLPRSHVRLEGYYKRLSPMWRNVLIADKYLPVERGYAYGLDVFVKKEFDRMFLWFGYSYGIARDVAGPYEVYRLGDRRHALTLDLNVSAGNGWNFNTLFRYASGRPYTEHEYIKVTADTGEVWVRRYGYPNAARTAPYSTVNLGIRKVSQVSWGNLFFELQITNVFNNRSALSKRWKLSQNRWGEYQPTDASTKVLPRLISFGIGAEL